MAITRLHSGLISLADFAGGLPAGMAIEQNGGGTVTVAGGIATTAATTDGYPHTNGGLLKFPGAPRASFVLAGKVRSRFVGTNHRVGIQASFVNANNSIIIAIENANLSIDFYIDGLDNVYQLVPFTRPANNTWMDFKLNFDGLKRSFTVDGVTNTVSAVDPKGYYDTTLFSHGEIKLGAWCNGNEADWDDVALCESNYLTITNVPAGHYVMLPDDTTHYLPHNGTVIIDLGTKAVPVVAYTIYDASGTAVATFSGTAYGGDVYESGLAGFGICRGAMASISSAVHAARSALTGPPEVIGLHTTGRLKHRSSFVNVMTGLNDYAHDFQYSEGIGWPPNGIQGTLMAKRVANLAGDTSMDTAALSLLDHYLYDGFFGGVGTDAPGGTPDGTYKAIRNDQANTFQTNFKGGLLWCGTLERGWNAYALMGWYDHLPASQRKTDCANYAKAIVDWNIANITPGANGNFPRYIVPETGANYLRSTNGINAERGMDPNAQYLTPALVTHLMAMTALTKAGIYDYSANIATGVASLKAYGNSWVVTANLDYDSEGVESHALIAWCCYELGEYLSDNALLTMGDEHTAQLLSFLVPGFSTLGHNSTAGLFRNNRDWIYPESTCYLWETGVAANAMIWRYLLRGGELWADLAVSALGQIAAHGATPTGAHPEGILYRPNAQYPSGVMMGAVDASTSPSDIKYTEPLLNNVMLALPMLTIADKAPSVNKAIKLMGADWSYVVGNATGGGATAAEIVAAIKADAQIGTPAKAGDAMTLTAGYDAAKTAAPAATALSNIVWTNEKAGFIDSAISGAGITAEAIWGYVISGISTAKNVMEAIINWSYGLSALNQKIVQIGNDTAPKNITDITYNSQDKKAVVTFSNGNTATYTYDTSGRLKTITFSEV